MEGWAEVDGVVAQVVAMASVGERAGGRVEVRVGLAGMEEVRAGMAGVAWVVEGWVKGEMEDMVGKGEAKGRVGEGLERVVGWEACVQEQTMSHSINSSLGKCKSQGEKHALSSNSFTNLACGLALLPARCGCCLCQPITFLQWRRRWAWAGWQWRRWGRARGGWW
jgi:hypothetical protein